MDEDGAFSHKIDYVTFFQEILNLEGHPNCITGSKVTVILLNAWILPVGGAASGRVCAQPAKQACFGTLEVQRRVTIFMARMLEIREDLLEKSSLPVGSFTGPVSTVTL